MARMLGDLAPVAMSSSLWVVTDTGIGPCLVPKPHAGINVPRRISPRGPLAPWGCAATCAVQDLRLEKHVEKSHHVQCKNTGLCGAIG